MFDVAEAHRAAERLVFGVSGLMVYGSGMAPITLGCGCTVFEVEQRSPLLLLKETRNTQERYFSCFKTLATV